MELKFLEDFYKSIRKTMVSLIAYFVLQTIFWILLGVLIVAYPYSLNIIFTIFFIVIGIVSLYFAILITGYLNKMKKIKDKFLK